MINCLSDGKRTRQIDTYVFSEEAEAFEYGDAEYENAGHDLTATTRKELNPLDPSNPFVASNLVDTKAVASMEVLNLALEPEAAVMAAVLYYCVCYCCGHT